MTRTRLAAVAALTVGAALGLGDRARASYSYSTTVTIDPAGTGGTSAGVVITPTSLVVNGVTETGFAATFGGTTVDFLGTSRSGFLVPSTNTLNIFDIAATTATNPPPSDSFTVGYTANLTLTNNPPPGTPGSLTLPVHGIITVNSVNTGNGTIANAFTSPTSGSVTVGGITFNGAVNAFSPPTVNGGIGSIGGFAEAVPEPSSIALLGLGAVGIVGAGRARRRAARRA